MKYVILKLNESSDNNTKIHIIQLVIDGFRSDDFEHYNNFCDFFTEIFSNKQIFYLILKSQKLVESIHNLIISNIDNVDVAKDLIKILTKFNDNIIKDVGGIATKQITTNFYDSNVNNLAFNCEDESSFTSNIIETVDWKNNSLKFIFENIFLAFKNLIEDFCFEKVLNGNLITVFGKTIKTLGLKK